MEIDPTDYTRENCKTSCCGERNVRGQLVSAPKAMASIECLCFSVGAESMRCTPLIDDPCGSAPAREHDLDSSSVKVSSMSSPGGPGGCSHDIASGSWSLTPAFHIITISYSINRRANLWNMGLNSRLLKSRMSAEQSVISVNCLPTKYGWKGSMTHRKVIHSHSVVPRKHSDAEHL